MRVRFTLGFSLSPPRRWQDIQFHRWDMLRRVLLHASVQIRMCNWTKLESFVEPAFRRASLIITGRRVRISNHQSKELESPVSPRKQRTEVFLIANFGTILHRYHVPGAQPELLGFGLTCRKQRVKQFLIDNFAAVLNARKSAWGFFPWR